ncbi:MAG: hypothetical protein R2932_49160 [Caldilineaceae bacterium]
MGQFLWAERLYSRLGHRGLWGIGVIVMAIGLFFVALSTNRADAQRWLFTAVVLFLLAFTASSEIAILRLDYRIDLLLTLYLYPPFSFWICIRIGVA